MLSLPIAQQLRTTWCAPRERVVIIDGDLAARREGTISQW